MKRFATIVLGLLIASVGVAGPARAASGVVSPDAEAGFQQISQCLQSHNDLAVLLAVDESSSLQQTDPQDKRAKLLANLVQSLGRQAGVPTANGTRQIQLAVSTFSMDYRPLVPWTTLTPDTTGQISSELEREIPQLDQGGGTNHPEALKGARNQMADLSATGGGQRPCEVTILFTDGVLDVSDDEAVNQAAARDMCTANGVVDGVRRDGINLVTVMLFDPRVAEQFPTQYKQGRDLLKAAAEGQGGTTTCGTVPIPANYAKGAYLEGGVDALASLFASAFALSQGATLVPGQGSPFAFNIDNGIASFSVIGLAPNGITLAGPDGQTITVDKGAVGPDGTSAVWDFDNVTINKTVTPQDIGKWTVSRPGQNDAVSLFLETGLGIKLASTSLVAGEKAEIKGQVVRPGSTDPVDLSIYKKYDMTASVVGASAEPVKLNSDGSFSGFITPNGDGTSAQFDVSLNLTTSSGQQLQPVSGRFSLPITLPKEFPALEPSQLTLSPLVGRRGKAEGSLVVTGSDEGPTKVCVASVKWTGVDDASIYATDQTSGCFDLAVNEKKTVNVAVTTMSPADELVSGAIPLTLTSAKGTVRTVAVPTQFTASRPLNKAVLWGVVAALALLGILLPLLMLYLVNRRLARFRPVDGLRAVAVPASVGRTGIKSKVPVGVGGPAQSTDTVAPFSIPADKLRAMPPLDKAPRELGGPDGSSMQTRMPRSFFGTPSASVVAGPGSRVFSNIAPHVQADGLRAPMSLGLGDAWYVTVAEADLVNGDLDRGIPATVSAFVPPAGAGADSVEDIAVKLRQFTHYKAILESLQSAAIDAAAKDSAPPTAPSGPSGSPPKPPDRGAPPRPAAGPPSPRGGPHSPGSSGPVRPAGASGPPSPGRPPSPPTPGGGPRTPKPPGPQATPPPQSTPRGPSGPPRGPSGPPRPPKPTN